jgi:hypothetical protein
VEDGTGLGKGVDTSTHAVTPVLLGSEQHSSTLLLARREFSIHISRTATQRRESLALVAKKYRARGYDADAAVQARLHREQVTFVARNATGVFGTLTLCVDSPFGLPADAEYSAELSAFRLINKKLAELTALAVDPQRRSKEVLGALFHVSYVFGALHKIDDVFIEVHPRHVPFYTRMLGFNIAGDCRLRTRVNAPARLLHIPLNEVAKHVARLANRRTEKPTLYSYFCSTEESRIIARSLMSLNERG